MKRWGVRGAQPQPPTQILSIDDALAICDAFHSRSLLTLYESVRNLVGATNYFVYKNELTEVARMAKPTESELTILRVLWEHGPSTVRTVHDTLSRTRATGYTGTLKLMQIMADKGLVTRDVSQRSHVYTAAVREQQTQKQLVKDLLKSAFSGSTDKLVMQALSAKKVTDEELAEIRRMLDELETKRKGSS